MARRTLIDAKTGSTSEFITEDDKIIYHTKQDIQPVIEHCKTLAENKPGKDFRHVAEVPMVIYQKAMREGWVKDKAKWKKWLNEPENKVFRTWQGKV